MNLPPFIIWSQINNRKFHFFFTNDHRFELIKSNRIWLIDSDFILWFTTLILTNITTAIGLSGGNPLTGGAGDHSSQMAAVNLANQAMVSQTTGGATQIRTLNTQQQQLLQLHPQQQVASNALAQQNVVRLQNSVQVSGI